MDPSNYANRHEQLGVGDNTPTSKQNSREPGDFVNNTKDTLSAPRRSVKGGDSGYSHGSDAKWNTVAGTEIGDPHGRVPTARDTHEQLAAARSTELPVDASRTAPETTRSGYGDVTPGVSTTARQHRNSNYAPGYEEAAKAVPSRAHAAADHHPHLLSHEPVTPLTEVPPDVHGSYAGFDQGPAPPVER